MHESENDMTKKKIEEPAEIYQNAQMKNSNRKCSYLYLDVKSKTRGIQGE